MSEIFNIPKVKYEGPSSKNKFAFKFYDANKVIMGKPMKEHLPFAMAWWHNLCAGEQICLAEILQTKALVRLKAQ